MQGSVGIVNDEYLASSGDIVCVSYFWYVIYMKRSRPYVRRMYSQKLHQLRNYVMKARMQWVCRGAVWASISYSSKCISIMVIALRPHWVKESKWRVPFFRQNGDDVNPETSSQWILNIKWAFTDAVFMGKSVRWSRYLTTIYVLVRCIIALNRSFLSTIQSFHQHRIIYLLVSTLTSMVKS